ncbi:hypothetical protein MK139_06140 [bacterium]|jgi:hypothetical protein|nr:hypothetical protein [Gemmatimonadota bacterium]MCH2663904.1 hypothetical protein [bacterium]HCK11025.1 hypothetical protein [Candidatus Latescibacterota bacterium]
MKRSVLILLALCVFWTPLRIQAETKNPKAAAFLSLLVPGLGEIYAGGPKSGRFFLFTEASLWAGLALFEHLETTRRENFKAYASAHAGLNTTGKSDTFLEEVTVYESIYSRNAHKLFTSGENASLVEETPHNIWEWDSSDSRSQFRVLRRKANSARQKGLLFVGGLLFNRFASAINASHIARKTLPRLISLQIRQHPTAGTRAILSAPF